MASSILHPLPGGFVFGYEDVGSATSTPAINAAYVHNTSGPAMMIVFCVPVSQSAATLTAYLYVTAVTGSPDFQMSIYDGPFAGDDNDRPDPDGADLVTSPSTASLTSADDGTWIQFTGTCSLTKNQVYWVIIHNTSGVPGSNYATWQYRPALDGGQNIADYAACFRGAYTLSGMVSSDPVLSTAHGLGVIKFSDGTIIGNPYASTAAHANNTNDRGTRFKFSEDVVAWGAHVETGGSAMNGIEINAASGGANQIQVLKTAQAYTLGNTLGAVIFEPITLTGGAEYDLVGTMASGSTSAAIYSMGEAEGSLPADVLACRAPSAAHVTGATPGSYTVDTSKIMRSSLLLSDNPAIAGGGGGMLVHPGTSGGAHG